MSSSSTNPSQILSDARILATRLQERDKMTDSLIRHAQAVTEKINCLKEYKEDLNDLHELRIAQRPRSVLVHNLQQENRQIKILQDENRQLKLALEEHQATLDIIMQRYRQQVVEMIKLNKLQQMADSAIDGVHKNNFVDESNKLVEFARLFDQCLKSGEESSMKDQEELTRLRTENQTLRQLLKIAAHNDPNFFVLNLIEAKNHQASTSIESKNENEQNTPTNEVAPAILLVDDKQCNEVSPVIPLVNDKPSTEPTPESAAAEVKIVADSTASASKISANGPVSSSVCSKVLKASAASSPNTTSAGKSNTATTVVTVNGNNNNNNSQPTTTTAASSATSTKNSRPSSTASTKRVSLPHVQPPMTTSVKKSTSQDSAMVNGGTPVATPTTTKPHSATTTPSKAPIVKKKSSTDMKIGNAGVAANLKPTSKSSTPVVNKTKGASVR